MTTQLETGTYSHGTLRDEDMLVMFDTIGTITECDWCKGEAKHGRMTLSHLTEYDELDDPCECSQCDEYIAKWRDNLSETINYLFDHVEEHHTPDGFYFGSIEGDGSDFGVWGLEDE